MYKIYFSNLGTIFRKYLLHLGMFSPPITTIPTVNGFPFGAQPVLIPRPPPLLPPSPQFAPAVPRFHTSPPRMGAQGQHHHNQGPHNAPNGPPTEGPLQLRKLFIGGLSHDTDDNQLATFYGQWGTVVDCIVIRDPHTKASRGFGFVTYSQVPMAELAMAHRPHVINNKTVDPKRAIPREDMVYYTTAPNGNYGGGPPPGPDTSNDEEFIKHKIFIHGLERSGHYMVDALREYFNNFGNVLQIEINGKQHKPVAFVIFEDDEGAQRCLAQQEHTINGRQCEIIKAGENGKEPVVEKESSGHQSPAKTT